MNIEYKEYKLSNGLNVILSKRNNIPIAILNILFKVGSKDEDKGQRGIAHLFEHLMFEGSPNIKGNKFDEILSSRGGDSNAFTTYDSTGYYIMLPSNELETAMWLDSDRLTGFEISEEIIEIQKKVVIEEKKQMYDNAPYGTVEIESSKRLFPKSGYGSPVIGNETDIKNISKTDLVNFYTKNYSPSNAVISVVGDIEYDSTFEMIEKYYGNLSSNGIHHSRVFEEDDITSEIVIEKYDNVSLPARFIFYRLPEYGTDDFYTSIIFNGILSSGESSRLQRKLVYDLELLTDVQSYVLGMKNTSIYSIDAFLQQGKSFSDVSAEIDKIVVDIQQGNFSDEEITKIKNRILTTLYSKSQLNLYVSERLTYLKTFLDDCSKINSEIYKYEKVTKQDIIEFANKYLKNNQRVVLNYFPNKK